MIKILTEDRINMRDDEHEIYKDSCPNCCSYVFYMVGTWVQEMLNIPIPGSLIGMFLLLVLLSLKVLPVKWFDLEQKHSLLLCRFY